MRIMKRFQHIWPTLHRILWFSVYRLLRCFLFRRTEVYNFKTGRIVPVTRVREEYTSCASLQISAAVELRLWLFRYVRRRRFVVGYRRLSTTHRFPLQRLSTGSLVSYKHNLYSAASGYFWFFFNAESTGFFGISTVGINNLMTTGQSPYIPPFRNKSEGRKGAHDHV